MILSSFRSNQKTGLVGLMTSKNKNYSHGGKREGSGKKPLPKNERKVPAYYRLPRWIIEELKSREESATSIVEKALTEYLRKNKRKIHEKK